MTTPLPFRGSPLGMFLYQVLNNPHSKSIPHSRAPLCFYRSAHFSPHSIPFLPLRPCFAENCSFLILLFASTAILEITMLPSCQAAFVPSIKPLPSWPFCFTNPRRPFLCPFQTYSHHAFSRAKGSNSVRMMIEPFNLSHDPSQVVESIHNVWNNLHAANAVSWIITEQQKIIPIGPFQIEYETAGLLASMFGGFVLASVIIFFLARPFFD